MYKIEVEDGRKGGYETNGPGRRLVNFFLIPILNSLPSSFHNKVKHTNRSAGSVVENKTTHAALETLYHKGEKTKQKKKHFLEGFFHEIWFNTNNSKAVRNRLMLVKRLISEELAVKKDLENIYILSIASGSSRAVVESLHSSKIKEQRIFSYFLDKSEKAIDYSKNLVKEYGLLDETSNFKFQWIHDTANSFPKYIDKPVDIVEMVGLLDYFDDEKVIRIFNTIYNNLNEGGVLITSNIVDNAERQFLDRAIGWKMIYRYGEEFAALAEKAGFKRDKIRVIYEPLKVHVVLIARK